MSPDEPLVERFVRQADGSWAQTESVGREGALELATVPASVPLADVYLGVEFPPTGERPL